MTPRTTEEMEELSALSPFFQVHKHGEYLTCHECKKQVKLPSGKMGRADLVKLSLGLLKNHRRCLAKQAKAAQAKGGA